MKTIYYKSQRGQINTEEAWKEWLMKDFWPDIRRAAQGYTGVKMPADTWERTVKVLKLEQIPEHEVTHINNLKSRNTYICAFMLHFNHRNEPAAQHRANY